MARVREDRRDRALLGDLAGVHHEHPVARLGDDRQVVGDQDQRQPELLPQPLEELQDLGLDHHVERGRRLVADDHRRVAGEGHRDHRPLAHPAGELVRDRPSRAPAGCRRARAARPARLCASRRETSEPLLQRLGDLIAHAADRVERVHRALEDDRDLAPPVAPQRVRRLLDEVDPEQLDASRSTIRAFAGSRRTSDSAVVVLPQPDSPAMPSASPSFEPEAHVVDGVDRRGRQPEVRRQVLDAEERRVRVRLLRQRPLAAPGHPRRRARRRVRWPATSARALARACAGRRVMPVIGAQPARIEDVVQRVAEERERERPRARRAPGGTKYHHAPRPGAPTDRADSRSWPHDGWNGSPSPTNDSVVSVRIAPANVSTALATIRFMTFGRMCRRMMWRARRADDARPIDERALPQRQRLRPDDPGRRRPARDADHDAR